MKKLLLLSVCSLMGVAGFAQDIQSSASGADYRVGPAGNDVLSIKTTAGAANKNTGNGPQFYYTPYDSMSAGTYYLYILDSYNPIDSGYNNGTNLYNLKSWAQYYNLVADVKAPVDTTLDIMGVVARWTGKVSTSSTKSVSFNVWKRDNVIYPITGRPKYALGGEPQSTPLATKSVAATALNLTNKGKDTGWTIATFSTPASGINYAVYVGCTLNGFSWSNLGGDTISLSAVKIPATKYSGIRDSIKTSTGDTVITAYTLVQQSNGAWRSNFDVTGPYTGGNIVTFPILRFVCPTCGSSTNGVKPQSTSLLTFYGNSPNPATTSTTVKFALSARADVTISLLDATGKLVLESQETGLSAGEHLTKFDVSKFSAGTYVYIVRASDGTGLAAQMIVTK